MMLIELHDVTKVYRMGDVEVRALNGVTLGVERGELTAIMGPSGSGKSTLMNILGCLDQVTSGEYLLEGTRISTRNDDQLAEIRNRRIGFVFQSYNLLPRTTALDNVEVPLVYAGASAKVRRQRAMEALEAVGLGDRLNHKPNELSGGQQQRVAIARALINHPAIIMADEPTGNLDTRSSEEIMAIFQTLNRDQGITVVFVTHEHDIAAHTRRVLHLRDGRITSDEQVAVPRLAVDVLATLPPANGWLHGEAAVAGAT